MWPPRTKLQILRMNFWNLSPDMLQALETTMFFHVFSLFKQSATSAWLENHRKPITTFF